MNDGSSVRLMKPGPAISAVATPARSAASRTVCGDLARVAAELLGQRQRAVGLGVGVVRRAHDRVDAGAAGDRVERRLEPVGEDVERIGHEPPSVPPIRCSTPSECSATGVRASGTRMDSDGGARPASTPAAWRRRASSTSMVRSSCWSARRHGRGRRRGGRAAVELDRHHAVVEPRAVLDLPAHRHVVDPAPAGEPVHHGVEALAVEQPVRRLGGALDVVAERRHRQLVDRRVRVRSTPSSSATAV